MGPDPEPVDPYPGLLAIVDQAIASAPLIAKWAWALFGNFKAEGFTEEQALRLTMNQLRVLADAS